jgi:hypothetical protein
MIMRGLEGFLMLKAYLKATNDLTDERCLTFRPDDKVSMDRLRGLNDETSATHNTTPFNPVAATAATLPTILAIASIPTLTQPDPNPNPNPILTAVHAIAADYNRLSLMFDRGADDFTVASKKPSLQHASHKKRPRTKRPQATPHGTGTGTGTKRKRRARYTLGNTSDEEEGEDEDDPDPTYTLRRLRV